MSRSDLSFQFREKVSLRWVKPSVRIRGWVPQSPPWYPCLYWHPFAAEKHGLAQGPLDQEALLWAALKVLS